MPLTEQELEAKEKALQESLAALEARKKELEDRERKSKSKRKTEEDEEDEIPRVSESTMHAVLEHLREIRGELKDVKEQKKEITDAPISWKIGF